MQLPRTTREVAAYLSDRFCTPIEEWQIRRLYECGDLDEPPRFGGKRMIDQQLVPTIIKALQNRNWLRLATGEDKSK